MAPLEIEPATPCFPNGHLGPLRHQDRYYVALLHDHNTSSAFEPSTQML